MPFSKLCFPRQLPEQLWEQESKTVAPPASWASRLSGSAGRDALGTWVSSLDSCVT